MHFALRESDVVHDQLGVGDARDNLVLPITVMTAS